MSKFTEQEVNFIKNESRDRLLKELIKDYDKVNKDKLSLDTLTMKEYKKRKEEGLDFFILSEKIENNKTLINIQCSYLLSINKELKDMYDLKFSE